MNDNSALTETIPAAIPPEPSPILFATPTQLVYVPPSPPRLPAPAQETKDLVPAPQRIQRKSPQTPKKTRNYRATPDAAPAATDSRHSRKCQVCRHPDREAIEEEFLGWHYTWNIASAYNVPARAIYRHVRALGLLRQRDENLRSVLGLIMERAEKAPVTGDTIIRAVRAYTCLTDNNQWIEPTSNVVFATQHNLRPALEASLATTSNRHTGD